MKAKEMKDFYSQATNKDFLGYVFPKGDFSFEEIKMLYNLGFFVIDLTPHFDKSVILDANFCNLAKEDLWQLLVKHNLLLYDEIYSKNGRAIVAVIDSLYNLLHAPYSTQKMIVAEEDASAYMNTIASTLKKYHISTSIQSHEPNVSVAFEFIIDKEEWK